MSPGCFKRTRKKKKGGWTISPNGGESPRHSHHHHEQQQQRWQKEPHCTWLRVKVRGGRNDSGKSSTVNQPCHESWKRVDIVLRMSVAFTKWRQRNMHESLRRVTSSTNFSYLLGKVLNGQLLKSASTAMPGFISTSSYVFFQLSHVQFFALWR